MMHQKQGIQDCVQKEVQAWDYARPVEVLLTSGYGHALPWVLHEFNPATEELLQQYQYLQDVGIGQSVRFEKWSPPLGIIRLDPSDVWLFERYLDELMTVEHLPDLPWTCFEEESQFNDFQATMLDMICKLYLATIDRNVSRPGVGTTILLSDLRSYCCIARLVLYCCIGVGLAIILPILLLLVAKTSLFVSESMSLSHYLSYTDLHRRGRVIPPPAPEVLQSHHPRHYRRHRRRRHVVFVRYLQ
jgi:hypothetical protein